MPVTAVITEKLSGKRFDEEEENMIFSAF